MSTPICPILSIQSDMPNVLCLGESCALYLPPAKRCSLVFMGYKAMMEVQSAQPQPPQNAVKPAEAAPPPARPVVTAQPAAEPV